jgi:hypothetical protein
LPNSGDGAAAAAKAATAQVIVVEDLSTSSLEGVDAPAQTEEEKRFDDLRQEFLVFSNY